MIHSVVVESPSPGRIQLYLDGKDISTDVCYAKIVLEAGKQPQMELKFPFHHLELNDLDMNIHSLDRGEYEYN